MYEFVVYNSTQPRSDGGGERIKRSILGRAGVNGGEAELAGKDGSLLGGIGNGEGVNGGRLFQNGRKGRNSIRGERCCGREA